MGESAADATGAADVAITADASAAIADFGVEPLSRIATSLLEVPDREQVFLLAERPPRGLPYALPLELPRPGHALRERGEELLWARAVTVVAAVVGTAWLRLVCEHDETFDYLVQKFNSQPLVTEHLRQYGDFTLERALMSAVPVVLRDLPFGSRDVGAHLDSASGPTVGSIRTAQACQLYIGVDYGRSDVKCAIVDGTGGELATFVSRWWRLPEGAEAHSEKEYIDPALFESIDGPLRCLGEAALEVLTRAIGDASSPCNHPKCAKWAISGLGVSAAGCVLNGRLCGLPPAFGGCEPEAARSILDRLEHSVLEYVGERLVDRFGSEVVAIEATCLTFLVNDGDASAMWGAPGLGATRPEEEEATVGDAQPGIGLYLSCGTGLAGGIAREGGDCCAACVLEMGKLIIGLPLSDGFVPIHDTLGVQGAAQGMAGTQRSFFNLLEARGGARIEGKAEQRAAIVAMQKRPLDDEVRGVFHTLGIWLAQFVVELSEYLPFQLTHVEVGGKLTDAGSGEIMLETARRTLASIGIQHVQRAAESEFGQAIAMALGARTSHAKFV